MGMAASQARYLALVARKSNCEYEGQQINQARLILSNQSANLFNQMLGLTVPVPPSTQDFTRTQYSFTDGNHSYVVDSWRQLPESDTQYNYVVNTHYFTDVYTGGMRKMAEPQVQLGGMASSGIAPLNQIQAMRTALRVAEEVMNTKYTFWQNTKTTQEAAIAALKAEAQRSDLSYLFRNEINGVQVDTSDLVRQLLDDGEPANILYRISYSGDADFDDNEVINNLKNMLDLGIITVDQMNSVLLDGTPDFDVISNSSDLDNQNIRDEILQKYALATDADGYKYIAKISDLNNIKDQIDAGNIASFSAYQITGGSGFHETSYYINDAPEPDRGQINLCQDIIDAAKEAYDDVKEVYDQRLAAYRNLVQPTYIGNSQLTYLDELSEEQEVELHQVVRDMIAQEIDTDILNCFDSDGNYLGGIYSFTIYGTTYYTTYNNLLDAYASNANSNNLIDAQYRMPYYNASYVNTRVDQEGRALIETDSSGRFTSIRFENDSVPYTLKMETITDSEAYEDAMNQYYYENAKYDKMVQDINAKTSIIQREDQELELRLKQLDTEQNALSTEIDAVSKVVKDNVESSFKTFGG